MKAGRRSCESERPGGGEGGACHGGGVGGRRGGSSSNCGGRADIRPGPEIGPDRWHRSGWLSGPGLRLETVPSAVTGTRGSTVATWQITPSRRGAVRELELTHWQVHSLRFIFG